MELLYGLSVEAEVDVVKGLRSLLLELVEDCETTGRLIDPDEIIEILERTK